MEHYELVQEMPSVERMATQDRLKHAKKRRAQQMKKWGQYERQLEKESAKRKKNADKDKHSQRRPKAAHGKGNVMFAHNISLLEAAARNDLNEVRALLDSGVSPDVTNEDGLTALHQCCIDDSEDMMKLLLDYSANVNACDSEMWTPLHAAATCGHVALCKQLIDRGAELLAVNADGNMPYDICEDEVTLDHIETEMAKRGITQEQIDVTRLATEHKMLADLKEFASKGGDLEVIDHIGATLLHIAAANGYIEVAEFLLDNHVSVETRDYESWQPVHAAAYWAQQEILELLVESGADLDSKTKNGETPFDLCEEPDLKQKILDMKDEIESKRSIRQQRLGSQRRHRVSSRNVGQSSDSLYSSNSSLNLKTNVSASIRRSSMRGDKSQLFKREHKEEALHFGLSLHDEESLMEAEEEQEPARVTDLDEVTIVLSSEDGGHVSPPVPTPKAPVNGTDTPAPAPPPPTVTTITVPTNKPTPKPRSLDHTDSGPSAANSATDLNRPSQQPAAGQRNGPTADRSFPAPPPSSSQQQSSQNAPGQRSSSNHAPPQPVHPAASGERRQSGTTLSDLKKLRSSSRENLLDAAVQNMFLESVQGGRQRGGGGGGSAPNSVRGGYSMPPPREAGGDKAKNGHNNNNSSSGVNYSATDGQLRRYVAPTDSPVVGGEDKQKCCVIL